MPSGDLFLQAGSVIPLSPISGFNAFSAIANEVGFNGSLSSAATTSSATLANIYPPKSFTKYFNNSNIAIEFFFSFWINGAVTTTGQLGFLFNSTLVPAILMPMSTASYHRKWSGIAIGTGLAAGSYTIQPQWARFSGTGTPTVDAGDRFSWSAREISL